MRTFPDHVQPRPGAAKASDHKQQAKSPIASLAAKAQVGWPSVRNYRKNTLAANASKSKARAPYLRKVDINMYSSYDDLSVALEKMFNCFISCQSGLHKSSSKDGLTNSSKADALKDQEYVLTYEDKDAD